jgi:hypothetical protein
MQFRYVTYMVIKEVKRNIPRSNHHAIFIKDKKYIKWVRAPKNNNYQNNSYMLYYSPNYIIIISLLMSPLLGHRPSLWVRHKENGP